MVPAQVLPGESRGAMLRAADQLAEHQRAGIGGPDDQEQAQHHQGALRRIDAQAPPAPATAGRYRARPPACQNGCVLARCASTECGHRAHRQQQRKPAEYLAAAPAPPPRRRSRRRSPRSGYGCGLRSAASRWAGERTMRCHSRAAEQRHQHGDGGIPIGAVEHQRNGDDRQEHAEQQRSDPVHR